MSKRETGRLRVWCEDRTHEQFARRLFALPRFGGLDSRRITVFPAPSGRGAASAWIRERWDDIRQEARACRAQAYLGFLVIVDGDQLGPEARRRDIEAEDRRENDCRIAIWSPTWSVESWILWLGGSRDVDEGSSLKDRFEHHPHAARTELIERAVASWDSIDPLESERVPSLAIARRELLRLPFIPGSPAG